MSRADDLHPTSESPTTFPAAVSSSSLSSSFSSSASSSMLHHADSPANSSYSDILTPDHSVTSSLSTPTKSHFPSAAVSPAPRSSSLGVMGQTYSRPEPVVPASSTHSAVSSTPTSRGFKLKNAFGARRKQSEDANPIPMSLSRTRSKGKGRKTDDAPIKSSPEIDQSSGRRPLRAKQLTLQLASAFSAKHSSTTANSPISPGLPAPPPPPKPTVPPAAKTHARPGALAADNRGSVMVQSSAALQYMQGSQPSPPKEVAGLQQSGAKREKAEVQEGWRKSDSNMSFNTIRPGAGTIGNRASRPVSMAESSHSTHTIVPVNKRLSALVVDADFAMLEEGGQEVIVSPASFSGKTSPSGSVKSRNRRSASLNLSSPFPRAKTPSPTNVSVTSEGPKPTPQAPADRPCISPSSSTREIPTLIRAAANADVTPMTSNAAVQTAGNNIRGRLAAWSATSNNNTSSPSRLERRLPDIPPQRSRVNFDEQASPQIIRQTAVSITSGFSAGLAKRAVEKMGRAWGGLHTSSGSGYSSASSTNTAPSSFSDPSAEDLRHPNVVQSPSKHIVTHAVHTGKGKQRRTPNAPSGAWSVASSTSSSVSDSEAYSTPTGPILGKRMRGPTRSTGGGAVFGRDLRSCVAETALVAIPYTQTGDATGRPSHNGTAGESEVQKGQDNGDLEYRRVPALVVRCAQHIFARGLQEEGLFRLTGRPSHMSKLRAEFDTGADYDLSECNVGDLDPHAVSSVFKAYLRELPEPILTYSLMPYFEAVLSAESLSREPQENSHIPHSMKGPALEVGAGGNARAMRKPPSLSTLAMPNFSSMRAPSESLVNALRSLIAGLPQENRDLLRTVADLIKATAKRSKETKMPLSNLLLVFCPSLNMNPPLLRVLCEADGIWDVPRNPLGQADVTGSKQENIMLEGSPGTPSQSKNSSTDIEDAYVSTHDMVNTCPEIQGCYDDASREATSEVPMTAVAQSNLGFAPAQQRPNHSGSPASENRLLTRASLTARRGGVATLYMDNESADDLVSQLLPPSPTAESGAISGSGSLSDDPSFSRSSSVSPALVNPSAPPSLSSSTDSLTSSETPSSSHLPLTEDSYSKTEISSSPANIKSADPPLPAVPQRSTTGPAVDGDIQFPSTGSLPTTSLNRRPTSHLHGPALASSLRPRRIKKPSLHLLFTRRSSASLHSPSINPASISAPTSSLQLSHSASPLSSASTPLSMYTAQTSTSSLPPVINMEIETSPLQLGMGVENDMRQISVTKPGSSHSNHTVTISTSDELALSSSPVSAGPNETPIANLFSTPSSSVLSFDINEDIQPLHSQLRPRPSQAAFTASTASFNHLSMILPDEETAEEDWAQSVLAAADTDGSWSAKNIMKFFGGGS